MSWAAELDEELGLAQLPPELRERAKQEQKSQGGYRYDSAADREHIRRQRAAIWAWFRGLGANLIKHGVNLTKVPLPVELCEPRSFLQRLTDSWRYADLLHAAAAATDPAERLKLVVAFAVGGMRTQVSCDKPFNPILGETLQATLACGCRVYCEQVSHHPPVSAWQVVDHAGAFEYTGEVCWSATFTGNSVRGTQAGTSRVRFASDGAVVAWTLPTIHVRGVLFGDRAVKYGGDVAFADALNGLRCELRIDAGGAPRRGLLRKVLGRARHPRGGGGGDKQQHHHRHGGKHHPDALAGDLVRLPPPGGRGGGGGGEQPVVLDSCSGSWLTELCWDKGVRSTALPPDMLADLEAAAGGGGGGGAAAASGAASGTASAGAAAQKQQHLQGRGDVGADDDDDAASVGCHSIGSLSSSSSSASTIEDGGQAAEQLQQQDGGGGGMNGHARHAADACSTSSSHSGKAGGGGEGSSGARLTAGALAAHTQQQAAPLAASAAAAPAAAAAAGARKAAGSPTPAAAAGPAASLPPKPSLKGGPRGAAAPAGPATATPLVASCATLGTAASSDATGHRSGRGIRVVKRLWSARASKLWDVLPLSCQDAALLPSDHRWRPDVQALGGGAADAAQRWKLALEQRQRADRAVRNAGLGAAADATPPPSEGGGGGGAGGSSGHHRRHSSAKDGSDAGAGAVAVVGGASVAAEVIGF